MTVQSHDGQAWLQRAIDGDLVLGGDDLERDLVDLVVSGIPALRDALHDEPVSWPLRRAARQTKEALSERPEAAFTCTVFHPETGRPLAAAETVTRAAFEACIGPRLRRVERDRRPLPRQARRGPRVDQEGAAGRRLLADPGLPRRGPGPAPEGAPPRRGRSHGGGGPGRRDLRERPARDRPHLPLRLRVRGRRGRSARRDSPRRARSPRPTTATTASASRRATRARPSIA